MSSLGPIATAALDAYDAELVLARLAKERAYEANRVAVLLQRIPHLAYGIRAKVERQVKALGGTPPARPTILTAAAFGGRHGPRARKIPWKGRSFTAKGWSEQPEQKALGLSATNITERMRLRRADDELWPMDRVLGERLHESKRHALGNHTKKRRAEA